MELKTIVFSMKTANSLRMDHTPIILKTAVFSRLVLLALIIFWRSLFEPYDTSAPLNPDCLSFESQATDPILWPKIGSAIEGSIVWDAVYFVRIAQCGYEYEQSYAFLPLLPICISFLSRTVFAPLIPVIGHRAVLGLSGYILNNVAFIVAAVYFYKISIIILKDQEGAFRASILFCFNPASIFYSSIYSESLHALFSLGGVYHLISSSNNIAVLWFALAGSARSNGVLNAGYFCFQTMHEAYQAIFLKKHAYLTMQVLLVGALRCLCVFVPFVAFQAYGYFNICLGHFPDEISPWCKARVPLLYNYLQSHYWGVGFLKYFQVKQLPNFLLASPILSLALCSIIYYMKLQPDIFFSLGFQASPEGKNSSAVLFPLGANKRSNIDQVSEKSIAKTQENHSLRQRKQLQGEESTAPPSGYESQARPGYSSALVLPFVLHLVVMAATAFFVMHVQVSTRFLSASPPLYWFSSYLMVCPGPGRRWGYWIWAYCAAYILLGSLLFSNFYPFT